MYRVIISPFNYPYFYEHFDISGKRNVNMDNLIDEYINKEKFNKIEEHYILINNWKKECETRISKSHFKKLRTKQFKKCLDDDNAFIFYAYRLATVYKQKNYIKTSDKVPKQCLKAQYSYESLKNRYILLSSINYEMTIKDYINKNQRNLMTPKLREQIAKRDNYTCQLCGKYMPDGVGLQIDHIKPISKGGKTIISNLQVLCSKCNSKKSNKV